MIAQIVGKVVDTLLASNARMATKFLDSNKVVRATRQFKRSARRITGSGISSSSA